jgi:hypothetical protein
VNFDWDVYVGESEESTRYRKDSTHDDRVTVPVRVNNGVGNEDTHEETVTVNSLDISGQLEDLPLGIHTITIRQHGVNSVASNTPQWFRAFGCAPYVANPVSTAAAPNPADAPGNKQKIATLVSSLPDIGLCTDQAGKTAGHHFARDMFYGCDGVKFAMGPEFNLPKNITNVGNNFCYRMFYGCSGVVFDMNEAFNLPKGIEGNANYNFCYAMFSNCSGDTFNMNGVFTLPSGITAVSAGFCYSMFDNCSGKAFNMGGKFNLPQGIEGNVGGSFCAYMFRKCYNANAEDGFTMNKIFKLPDGITQTGNDFCREMFSDCKGDKFEMNDGFTLPSKIETVKDTFCYYMFSNCSGKAFNMKASFNLPQGIEGSVGTSFCAGMFRFCYHPEGSFTMSKSFQLPDGITTVGNGFCREMFNGCKGDAFEMSDDFNLPSDIETITLTGIESWGGSFCYAMFQDCSGYSFTMKPGFNLPSGITGNVGNGFCQNMFYGCYGDSFNMSSGFNLPQGITAVKDAFCQNMFNNCKGRDFTMATGFNLPQNIEGEVGTYFCSGMFSGCYNSEGSFTMVDDFNLPPGIMKVGDYFCYSMFFGCKGDGFEMSYNPETNSGFTLPQSIESVGNNFCQNMFYGCSGVNFDMSANFNLPSGITSVGNNFCVSMFLGCSGVNFDMSADFNLPSGIVSVGENFCERMFGNCGAGFSVQSSFKFPALTQTEVNLPGVFSSMFSGIQKDQTTKVKDIINGAATPPEPRATFNSARPTIWDFEGVDDPTNWKNPPPPTT